MCGDFVCVDFLVHVRHLQLSAISRRFPLPTTVEELSREAFEWSTNCVLSEGRWDVRLQLLYCVKIQTILW